MGNRFFLSPRRPSFETGCEHNSHDQKNTHKNKAKDWLRRPAACIFRRLRRLRPSKTLHLQGLSWALEKAVIKRTTFGLDERRKGSFKTYYLWSVHPKPKKKRCKIFDGPVLRRLVLEAQRPSLVLFVPVLSWWCSQTISKVNKNSSLRMSSRP
jgi:hypothetical protein